MTDMHKAQKLLSELESQAEKHAFDLAKGEEAAVLHKQCLAIIVGLAEVKASLSEPTKPDADEVQGQEVNKVSRRLKRWRNNRAQINAKILEAYLGLKHEGTKRITEELLRFRYSDDNSFNKNYPQMKIISPKNHGKVFEVVMDEKGERIEIWEPVQSYVNEYAKDCGLIE